MDERIRSDDMKFKREDIGLYFALGIGGAGVGLLIGALVASKMTPPEPLIVPWLDNDEPEEVKITPKKISRVKKMTKKELTPEVETFIEEFSPSAIQIEMLKKDLISIDELRAVILKQQLAKAKKPYDYSGPYRDDDKPDLADLVDLPDEEIEDFGIVDGRYHIRSDAPPEKDPKRLRVMYYDADDDVFYTMTRRGRPVPAGIEGVISEEAWITMMPYLVNGSAPLYVDDLETVKFYRFELLPLDEEELADEDDG